MIDDNNKSTPQQHKIRSMQSDLENTKKGSGATEKMVSIPKPIVKTEKPGPQQVPPQDLKPNVKKQNFSATQKSAPPLNLPGIGTAPEHKPPNPPPVVRPSALPPTKPPQPLRPPAPPQKLIKSLLPKPPQPQQPKIPQRPKEKEPKKPQKLTNKRRRLFLLGIGALVIIFIISAEIWWFFIRPDASQDPLARPSGSALPAPEETLPVETGEPGPPAAQEPVLASALLQFDRVETVTLTSAASQAIQNALSQALGAPREEGQLVRLVLLTSNGSIQEEITFSQFAQGLGLTIPETVMAQLAQTANIFIFSPTVFDRSTCQGAGQDAATCAGPRVGMVVQATESAALKNTLRDWEPTMVRDLRPLIAANITGETAPFLDATYRGLPVRYRNLPLNTATIDYTLVEDKWIVTTSKSSMFSAVDSLGN